MIDMSDDKNLYTVGEVAERFSVTVRTLHHWEAQGLLVPVERSWSNYRLYSVEDCARVQRMMNQHSMYSLRTIVANGTQPHIQPSDESNRWNQYIYSYQ